MPTEYGFDRTLSMHTAFATAFVVQQTERINARIMQNAIKWCIISVQWTLIESHMQMLLSVYCISLSPSLCVGYVVELKWKSISDFEISALIKWRPVCRIALLHGVQCAPFMSVCQSSMSTFHPPTAACVPIVHRIECWYLFVVHSCSVYRSRLSHSSSHQSIPNTNSIIIGNHKTEYGSLRIYFMNIFHSHQRTESAQALHSVPRDRICWWCRVSQQQRATIAMQFNTELPFCCFVVVVVAATFFFVSLCCVSIWYLFIQWIYFQSNAFPFHRGTFGHQATKQSHAHIIVYAISLQFLFTFFAA